MKTIEGNEYGPVTKAELDDWVHEGRVDHTCLLRAGDNGAWQPAGNVYPRLAAGGESISENPFAGIGQPRPSVEDNPLAGLQTFPAEVNPFAAPQAGGDYAAAAEGQWVTDGIRGAMQRTRPWVLMLAILGFVFAGLFILMGLGMMAFAAFGAPAVGIGIGVGLVYLLLGVLYALPSYFLLVYGLRIGVFLRGGDSHRLENALAAQATYWKVLGLIVLIVVVMYFGLIIVFLLFGAMA